MTNPLCDGSGCRALQIRAFIWAYRIPQAPTGLEVVGEVEGPSACLEFPDSWQITVSEVDALGNVVRSDTITSTLDDEVYLAIVNLDWRQGGDWFLATTYNFSPGSAQGWSLDLTENPDPEASLPFTAQLTTATRCSPTAAFLEDEQ
ncbi:MAG: hypothetical protein PVJ76_07810 [Gemmatimonadota bacterium]